MSRSTRSILVRPRLTSLAAALSIASASSSIGAADHKQPFFHHSTDTTHQQRVNQTLKGNFARVREAAHNGFAALPASHPATRAPTTVHVASTADSGSGSLRDALSNAAAGDVIDLSSMRGTLTLTSPLVPAASVTINGPGRDLLTLDGNHLDRVLTSNHSLKVSNVTIANGAAPAASPLGGCLFVEGMVTLSDVKLSNCTTVGSATAPAFGGALFVKGAANIYSSEFSGNSAISTYQTGGDRTGYQAFGGAIAIAPTPYYYGSTISDSILTGNTASGSTAAAGGAIFSSYYSYYNRTADVTLSNTTLSGNTAIATDIPSYYDSGSQQTINYGFAFAAGLAVIGGNVQVTGSHIETTGHRATAKVPAAARM